DALRSDRGRAVFFLGDRRHDVVQQGEAGRVALQLAQRGGDVSLGGLLLQSETLEEPRPRRFRRGGQLHGKRCRVAKVVRIGLQGEELAQHRLVVLLRLLFYLSLEPLLRPLWRVGQEQPGGQTRLEKLWRQGPRQNARLDSATH